MQRSTIDSLLRNCRAGESTTEAEFEQIMSLQFLDPQTSQTEPETFDDGNLPQFINIESEDTYEVTIPSIHESKPKVNLMSILNGKRNNDITENQLKTVAQDEKNLQLERDLPKGKKTINMKDFLSYPKKKVEKPVIVIPDGPSKEDPFLKYEKVSTKDLLSPKPKKLYSITLKVDKEALAFYKKFENSLKSRGTSVYVKGGGKKKSDKNASSVFDMMMKESAANTVRLTPLQKLQDLPPPVLKKDEFHVFENTSSTSGSYLQGFKPRSIPEAHAFEGEFTREIPPAQSTNLYAYTSIEYSKFEALQNLESNCPVENPIFSVFHNSFPIPETHKSQVWSQIFEPSSVESLLILDSNKKSLGNWITNAFRRLKSKSFGAKQHKRKKPKDSEMANFIVYDNYGDEDTDEDSFTPLLIIVGDTGVGKSASVYAAMKRINGYVHEINAGQDRSRRNISGVLKEFCTTQLVHKADEVGETQKGIVLLEDCDILFEQDRTFWTAVLEMLEISRRPFVITCTDPTVIPRSLLEEAMQEDAIINLNLGKFNDFTNIFKSYLWGCCFTHGYDVDFEVIDSLIKDLHSRNHDVRGLINACQFLCQTAEQPQLSQDPLQIIQISKTKNNKRMHNEPDLFSISEAFDTLGVCDIIENNAYSQIKHEAVDNEFVDLYYIDDTLALTQSLMPHERKLLDELYEITSIDQPYDIEPKNTQNQIRRYINEYVGSRSRPKPAYLQGSRSDRITRFTTLDNNGMSKSDPVGIPDGSISMYLSPTPFIVELAPYVRQWCSFQLGLNSLEPESRINTKDFIGWRDFQMKNPIPLKTAPAFKTCNP